MAELHGDHERTDVRFRPIAIFGAGLAVALVLVVAITYGMMQFLLYRSGERELARPEFTIQGRRVEGPEPPGPRLQPDPIRDMRELRAREEAALASYGWVDREAGVVRVPIDKAMELLLQRGPGRLRGEARR